MAGMKVTLELHGFKEMSAKLRDKETLGRPWRDAMRAVGQLGKDAGQAMAPIASGQTVNKFAYKVQAKPIPNWVVVRTTARHHGFAYPRIQEFSPYGYQGRKRGKNGRPIPPRGRNRNRGWFTRAMKRVEAGMEKILQQAADSMERGWAR